MTIYVETPTSGQEAVTRLLRDHPEWFPIVMAALEEAKTTKGGSFAGAWVLRIAKKYGVQWVPNLRKLVAYGILQKEGETSRRGNRAYYLMPDIEGVEEALSGIKLSKKEIPYTGHIITGAGVGKVRSILIPLVSNLASCGSPNISEENIEDYLEVSTDLAKPGYQYFLVRADGDSMNQAGINDKDIVLVKIQDYAEVGDRVVACIDDGGVTIKEFQRQGSSVLLMPRSDNLKHKPIIVENARIQGIVITTIK